MRLLRHGGASWSAAHRVRQSLSARRLGIKRQARVNVPRQDPGRRAAPSWTTYRTSIGDRSGLFAAIRKMWNPATALYPGSYLDLSPSTAIRSVTYVDTDRRAARFFADNTLLSSELQRRTLPGSGAEVAFLHLDYTKPLPLFPASFDLLISLYAGPVWEHCRKHLSTDGWLLANSSHGDASLAALDPSLRLIAAVHQRGDTYRLHTDTLDSFLIPKRPTAADRETIRRLGRGIAYTRNCVRLHLRTSREAELDPEVPNPHRSSRQPR